MVPTYHRSAKSSGVRRFCGASVAGLADEVGSTSAARSSYTSIRSLALLRSKPRNFDRTLTQLERLQRLRLGQPVPPKLEVHHSLS
jgi:hypothetical protein